MIVARRPADSRISLQESLLRSNKFLTDAVDENQIFTQEVYDLAQKKLCVFGFFNVSKKLASARINERITYSDVSAMAMVSLVLKSAGNWPGHNDVVHLSEVLEPVLFGDFAIVIEFVQIVLEAVNLILADSMSCACALSNFKELVTEDLTILVGELVKLTTSKCEILRF